MAKKDHRDPECQWKLSDAWFILQLTHKNSSMNLTGKYLTDWGWWDFQKKSLNLSIKWSYYATIINKIKETSR